MTAPAPTGLFGPLRDQLTDAAAAFAGSPDALAGILTGMVDDVDRALRERLEIFPVCHHSPPRRWPWHAACVPARPR